MPDDDDNLMVGKAAVGGLDSFGLQPTNLVLTTDGDSVEAGQGFHPNMIDDREDDRQADHT